MTEDQKAATSQGFAERQRPWWCEAEGGSCTRCGWIAGRNGLKSSDLMAACGVSNSSKEIE